MPASHSPCHLSDALTGRRDRRMPCARSPAPLQTALKSGPTLPLSFSSIALAPPVIPRATPSRTQFARKRSGSGWLCHGCACCAAVPSQSDAPAKIRRDYKFSSCNGQAWVSAANFLSLTERNEGFLFARVAPSVTNGRVASFSRQFFKLFPRSVKKVRRVKCQVKVRPALRFLTGVMLVARRFLPGPFAIAMRRQRPFVLPFSPF